jgi:hypothetical protein
MLTPEVSRIETQFEFFALMRYLEHPRFHQRAESLP